MRIFSVMRNSGVDKYDFVDGVTVITRSWAFCKWAIHVSPILCFRRTGSNDRRAATDRAEQSAATFSPSVLCAG